MAASDKDKPKGQHGGPRPNSGRKPDPIRAARTEYLNNLHNEAVKSMELLVKLRDDGAQPAELRRLVALDIMAYVWGKPAPRLPEVDEGKAAGVVLLLND